MVIALVLYPMIVAAGLFLFDPSLARGLLRMASDSVVFTSVLSLSVLTSVLVAAYRRRSNPLLRSAWLFLFCGLSVLFLASMIDPFLSGNEPWIEELFATASFFPLLFFSLSIASPLRLLMLSRRQRTLYSIAGIVVLLAVFAAVFFPWLLIYEGPRLHASPKHLLRLTKPVLDTILAEPIALLVLVIGLTRGSGPYLFIGLGMLLLIPEDIFDHLSLLRQMDPHGQFSTLLSVVSRLYLLNGALLGIFKREKSPR
jgi:hypothetical protein